MARRPVRRRSFGRRRARRVRQMQPLGLTAPLHQISTPIDGGALRVLGSGERRVPGDPRAHPRRAEVGRDPRVPVARRRGRQPARRGRARGRRSRRRRSRSTRTGSPRSTSTPAATSRASSTSASIRSAGSRRGSSARCTGRRARSSSARTRSPSAMLAHAEHHASSTCASASITRKLYIVDDRYLALGSMGIGDNHRHEWIDVMIEAEGAEHVRAPARADDRPRRVRSVARHRLPRPQPRGAPHAQLPDDQPPARADRGRARVAHRRDGVPRRPPVHRGARARRPARRAGQARHRRPGRRARRDQPRDLRHADAPHRRARRT